MILYFLSKSQSQVFWTLYGYMIFMLKYRKSTTLKLQEIETVYFVCGLIWYYTTDLRLIL